MSLPDPVFPADPLCPPRQSVPSTTVMSTTPPTTTSANSTASLPPRGYTIDQLANYVERQLGSPNWIVELARQSIIDQINDALARYSIYRPRLRFGAIPVQRGQFEYCKDADMGQGPVMVEFVQPNPVPVELFWGNLIDPAPLLRTGMDELDMFQRWQKTWMRVTSIKPDWLWDEARKTLLIWNPLDRYMCAVTWYENYATTEGLDAFGAQWVKEYSHQKSRQLYGEHMSKFSGAIPGPVQQLQFDSQKRDLAQIQIDKLEAQLVAAQLSTPVTID